jgi:biopolymer transport protein ExbD
MSVKINKGRTSGIVDLTPMLDVVFQLLLFFIVASRFADEERELKVVLPQASEAKPLIAKPTEFFVNVDREGRYYLGGRLASLNELDRQLAQLSANNPGRQTVVIRADKKCDWEFVVAVMNACNKAKIRDYRVTTAPAKGTG